MGSDNPRDLWQWMTTYEQTTSSRALAIAHNGNLSNQHDVPVIESFTGKPVDVRYARQQAKWERLYGDPDEGRWRGAPVPLPERQIRQLRALDFRRAWTAGTAKTKSMLEFEYARSA